MVRIMEEAAPINSKHSLYCSAKIQDSTTCQRLKIIA